MKTNVYQSRMINNFYNPNNSKNKLLDLIIGDKDKSERYLDLGAGNLGLLKYIADHKKYFNYCGVDIESDWYHDPDIMCLDTIKSFNTCFNINNNNNNIRTACCITDDILNFLNSHKILKPFLNIKYDCIIMSSILHEALKNPEDCNEYYNIIQQALTLLSNDGRLIIRDGVVDDFYDGTLIDLPYSYFVDCKFKDASKGYYLMMHYIVQKGITTSINLNRYIHTNNYERKFLKNFLSAYSWNGNYGLTDGFIREAQQDHFNLYIGDWETIRYLLKEKYKNKIKVELSFYPDEYKDYISKLVEWNRHLDALWSKNSAIMVITKRR